MKIKTWLTAWLLSFCIGFGALSALVTAFELYDVSLPDLGIYLSLLCALAAWAFLTKRGPIFLFSFMGVLLGCSLLWQGLWHSIQSVAYQLSTVFNAAYGWGELDVSYESEFCSQIPAVFFLGTLPAISLTWTICRQEKLLFPLSIALLPLYPCFVVTDTTPESWCFLLILGAALILVLTQSLRRLDHKAGHRITAFALIPAILLSVFLITSIPEEGCWEKFPALRAWVQPIEVPGNGTHTVPLSYIGMPQGNQMDLSQAGPLSGTGQTVMTVRSGYGGFLYLRYQSFDTYNGTQWLATDLPEDPACWPAESELNHIGSISISSTKAYEGLFIPYYARDGRYLQLQNGKLPNTQGLTAYWISVGALPNAVSSLKNPDLSPYLELPQATREAAQKILQTQHLETPEDILQYVQNCAPYSLQTGAMPQETGDFAIWFLEEAETGYCVHFATAAAVLLRAAGYPARYVTGYAVMTRRGIPAKVTEKRAHAWVEYADPEMGFVWQLFEATPVDFSYDPAPSPSTEPTQPSTEPTQPSTEATQPSTQTQPSTLPSQSTLPSGATSPSGTVSGPATVPSTQVTGQQKQEKSSMDLSWLWLWLVRLGSLLAVIAALWLQYRIRFRLRQKKLRTGTPNAQALARWQEILRLDRLLKTQPPEQLLELAEKARFSQHTISKAELFRLGQYLEQQRKALQTLPVWKRLFLRLIWAI